MNQAIGKTCWAIPEGYIPAYSHGPEPQFTSHETVWVLSQKHSSDKRSASFALP
jgi:hypothetical protein